VWARLPWPRPPFLPLALPGGRTSAASVFQSAARLIGARGLRHESLSPIGTSGQRSCGVADEPLAAGEHVVVTGHRRIKAARWRGPSNRFTSKARTLCRRYRQDNNRIRRQKMCVLLRGLYRLAGRRADCVILFSPSASCPNTNVWSSCDWAGTSAGKAAGLVCHPLCRHTHHG